MKTVQQMDLFLENTPGSLFSINELLGANGISMIAFHLAVEKDEGVLHFVASDPEKTPNILRTAGYRIEARDVIACEIPQHPGGLSAILKPLARADINIDLAYPCLRPGDAARLILCLGPVAAALEILEENWIRVLGDELYEF